MTKAFKFVLLISFILSASSVLLGQTQKLQLLGDFKDGWEKDWVEKAVGSAKTKYEAVEQEENLSLRATSYKSGSLLWRMLDIQLDNFGKLSWRWKIQKNLSDRGNEKTKKGDDYAARVFVVFDTHPVSWKTNALCYVWSANQPAQSRFKSPYTTSLGIIVLQTGKEKRGQWISEQRDFMADYEKLFGRPPTMVSAVAIMVDTDNSKQEATTWFDDLVIEAGKAKAKDGKRRSRILIND